MAIEITQINPEDLSTQIYEPSDINLISTFDIDTSLTSRSRIELFLYNLNKELIYSSLNFTQYNVLNDGQSSGNENNISQIQISPENNISDLGFTEGSYLLYYNFLNIFVNREPTRNRGDTSKLRGTEPRAAWWRT
jgi:hypothetical protein